MSEKSILEKALLQVEQLEEAVKQNAKGILESTMKQELKDLLKESEEVDEKPEDEFQDDVSEQSEDEENETDEGSDEETEETDDVETDDEFDTGSEEESEDEESDEFGGDFGGFEDDSEDEDDVLDMTNSSDEEVLKVFKSMKPEDGIVVKKDGENVSFETEEDEYIIKLDGEVSDDVSTDDTEDFGDEDFGSEDEESDEEVVYEIELDGESENIGDGGEDSDEDYTWFGDDEEEGETTPPQETDEAARTFANQVRKPSNHGKKFKAGRHEMSEEIERLKKQVSEYKSAIVTIKGKLNEVAVFNANLAYSTRLFTENSTTKNEKLEILKRFDNVEGLQESKKLFNTIKSELDTKKPVVNESIVGKLNNKSNKVSSTTEMLSEAKAYENTQFSRIKELMKYS